MRVTVMNETAATEGELGEPIFIKNALGKKLLGCGDSYYWGLARKKKIIIVGKGRGSRTYYPSIKAYAAELLAEAAAKTGEAA
jgi:hypothetical protein